MNIFVNHNSLIKIEFLWKTKKYSFSKNVNNAIKYVGIKLKNTFLVKVIDQRTKEATQES